MLSVRYAPAAFDRLATDEYNEKIQRGAYLARKKYAGKETQTAYPVPIGDCGDSWTGTACSGDRSDLEHHLDVQPEKRGTGT